MASIQSVAIWAKRLSSLILVCLYWASRFLRYCALVAMAAMALIVVIHVTMRYLLKTPLFFGEELTIIIMYVVIFGILTELFVRGEHLDVAVLVDKFPPKFRYGVDIVTNLVAVLFMGVFTWYAMRLAVIIYREGYKYEIMQILPKWPTFMLIAVSIFMSSIFLFIHLLKLLKREKAQMTERKGEK